MKWQLGCEKDGFSIKFDKYKGMDLHIWKSIK